MTRYGETEADDLFRAAAEREGYLEPGGKGLWAWYRDNGIMPPPIASNIVVTQGRDAGRYGREVTGLDMAALADAPPTDRRNTRQSPHADDLPTSHVSVRLSSESAGLTGRRRPQPNRWRP